jgi:hypothetical protein
MKHKGTIASSMDNINEYCNELEAIAASRAINTGVKSLPASTKFFLQNKMYQLQRNSKVMTEAGKEVDCRFQSTKNKTHRCYNNGLKGVDDMNCHSFVSPDGNTRPSSKFATINMLDDDDSDDNVKKTLDYESRSSLSISEAPEIEFIQVKKRKVDQIDDSAASMSNRVFKRLQNEYSDKLSNEYSKVPSNETKTLLKEKKTHINRFYKERECGSDIFTIKRLTRGGDELVSSQICSQDVARRLVFEYQLDD